MKHRVFIGKEEVGWVDGSVLSGPEQAEIFFDSILVKRESEKIKLGEVKTGFDRAEIFRRFDKEEPVSVGSVGRDGIVKDAEGAEAGRVEQDSWSEMYANAAGAALILLVCNAGLVAEAAAFVRKPAEKPVQGCRDDHVFGHVETSDPDPDVRLPTASDLKMTAYRFERIVARGLEDEDEESPELYDGNDPDAFEKEDDYVSFEEDPDADLRAPGSPAEQNTESFENLQRKVKKVYKGVIAVVLCLAAMAFIGMFIYFVTSANSMNKNKYPNPWDRIEPAAAQTVSVIFLKEHER